MLEEAGARRCSLTGLVELLDDYFHERALPPGSDRNIQRLDSERAAVQVMTIHKAKGLEADVVFLYGGTHRGNNPETKLWVYHENGERRFAIGATGDAKDELGRDEADADRRLSYVAITRARARLYLPYFPREALKAKASGYYQYLNRRLEALQQLPVHDKGGRILIDRVDFAIENGVKDDLAEESHERIASWQPQAALLPRTASRASLRAPLDLPTAPHRSPPTSPIPASVR